MRGSFVHSFRPISLGNAAKYTEKPREMSIVLNTPFTILKTLNKQPLQQKNYFRKDELEKIYTPVTIPRTSGPGSNLNVVIFILESWSKEFIGAFNRDLEGGTYKGYTPFLDSLIGRSKSFSRSFANGRRSIEALPSVVASIPSMVQPYVTSKYASNRITGLAALLSKLGYRTAFFHGAPNGSMGFEAFMRLAGYDEYYGMDEYGNPDDYDGIWGVWDEEFFQFFARELNGFEEPFHATIFSVSSHHPFKVPDRYEQTFKGGPLVSHKPTEYTDMALRKFFQTASRMPWFNNTLFVITADHTAPYSSFDIYKTQVGKYSVPIVFYCPSAGEQFIGTDSTVIQQIDIMPTILGHLNYPDPYFAFGKDVFDIDDRHFAVAFTENAYQLIMEDYLLQYRDDQTVGLYNYDSDQLLTENLVGKDPEKQAEMEMCIRAFIQQYNNRMIEDKLNIDSLPPPMHRTE
jgi:phosphoglycerol transferase MdoB-like AlkP superfamily enzyme